MTVAFAYDYGPCAGLGHRRRCNVIATALRALGVATIETSIVEAVDLEIDAAVVVVDSYKTRADDRDIYNAPTLVALDDLARDLDVSLVIEPAPGAKVARHRKAGRVLAGAQYALVDPALKSLAANDPKAEPQTLLIATGASDTTGFGAAMATRISERFESLTVRLVVGPWGDRTAPRGVELLESTVGLGEHLATADIVVTAGGVTLLESLCLGRPTIAVAIAQNQLRNVAGVVDAGAALSSDPSKICTAVARLVSESTLRAQLSEVAEVLIDGEGARRAAEAIITTSSEVVR